MRKVLFVMLIAALGVFSVSAAPAQSPVENFLELAGYFPDTTSMFGAFRTDDAMIEELDAVINLAGQFLPDALPPGFSLKLLYDQQIAPGMTVGKSIRPWLGDAVAVGLIAPFEEVVGAGAPPVVAALQITDPEEAEAFFDQMLEQYGLEDVYEKTTEGDFTVIASDELDKYPLLYAFAIGQDVAFIAGTADDLPLQPLRSNLSGNESFRAAVGMLPAEGYDALAYVDTPAINRAMMKNFNTFGGFGGPSRRLWEALTPLIDAMYAAQGPQALGFTILEGRSLALDASQLIGDTSQAEALGFTLGYPGAPVDSGFAANVPADAPLVILGTDIGPNVQNAFANWRALGDYIQETGLLGALVSMERGNERAAAFLNNLNLGDLVTFVNLGFAGMTGLNLEKDVLAWMDGDFAFYLRALRGDILPIALDSAVVVETSDSAATQNVVDRMGEAFDQYRVTYSRTDTGPRHVLVIPNVLRAVIPPEAREDVKDERQLDVLMGTNGEVFAMGTRAGVQFSLNPDGGLASDDAFQAAQALFVPDAQMVFYLSLRPLAPLIGEFMDEERWLLSMIESFSISASMGENGSVARMVLTISDEPPARTGSANAGSAEAEIEGVQAIPVESAAHVTGRFDYSQIPPAGGPHNPVWQDCGVYTEPIADEFAVHSLEHGTVWITYQPDLSPDQIEALQDITRGGTHRLLSPYPGIDSPIIVSAWGFQLRLDSADDPRLMDFIRKYESGPTAPEPGAACSGGETRTLSEME